MKTFENISRNYTRLALMPVLMLVLMLPLPIRAQEIIPQEGIARQFLNHLLNKEVHEMMPMFTDDFLQQVPEGQITEISAGLSQTILIVHGGRDYQVNINDYNAWKAALQNHYNTTFKLYPEDGSPFCGRRRTLNTGILF